MTDKPTIGMPYPWVLKRHLIRGDTFFFFSVSPATLAFGFEFLSDGFVLFLGCINIGWAGISSFEKRAASADRSPKGQDAEERLDAKHESAVGDSRDAPDTSA